MNLMLKSLSHYNLRVYAMKPLKLNIAMEWWKKVKEETEFRKDPTCLWNSLKAHLVTWTCSSQHGTIVLVVDSFQILWDYLVTSVSSKIMTAHEISTHWKLLITSRLTYHNIIKVVQKQSFSYFTIHFKV